MLQGGQRHPPLLLGYAAGGNEILAEWNGLAVVLNPFRSVGVQEENLLLGTKRNVHFCKMGGRKRGRRLGFLAPLLVVTSGDNSGVDLNGTLQGNKGSNTSCAAFSWEQKELDQTVDAVIFGSTTAATGTAAASTCRPSAPDLSTPCKFSFDIVYILIMHANE